MKRMANWFLRNGSGNERWRITPEKSSKQILFCEENGKDRDRISDPGLFCTVWTRDYLAWDHRREHNDTENALTGKRLGILDKIPVCVRAFTGNRIPVEFLKRGRRWRGVRFPVQADLVVSDDSVVTAPCLFGKSWITDTVCRFPM